MRYDNRPYNRIATKEDIERVIEAETEVSISFMWMKPHELIEVEGTGQFGFLRRDVANNVILLCLFDDINETFPENPYYYKTATDKDFLNLKDEGWKLALDKFISTPKENIKREELDKIQNSLNDPFSTFREMAKDAKIYDDRGQKFFILNGIRYNLGIKPYQPPRERIYRLEEF